MAIYDFSSTDKNGLSATAQVEAAPPPQVRRRDQIFSATATRLFFVLLIAGDLLWTCFAFGRMAFAVIGYCVTGGRVPYFKDLSERAWIGLRRSLVCGVSLLIALFSPSFGIMIACTYFLMYDKAGIEEVVPTSLQSQFKEFLPKE